MEHHLEYQKLGMLPTDPAFLDHQLTLSDPPSYLHTTENKHVRGQPLGADPALSGVTALVPPACLSGSEETEKHHLHLSSRALRRLHLRPQRPWLEAEL